jgi:putative hemolysin
MTALLAIEGAALLILFICSAFFSSAETALFSLDPIQIHRIRRVRPRAADRIDKLLQAPTKLLSTILIGNTLVNVAASALGYAIIGRLIAGHAALVAIPTMVALLLVFGEVAPKRLAMQQSEQLSSSYAGILSILMRLLGPVRALLEYLTQGFEKHIRLRNKPLTEDEFLTAVEASEEEGFLDEEERTMVDGIIRLADIQASDVMAPRVDLIGIDLDDDPSTYESTVRGSKFRYLPVYRETLDNVQGLVDVSRFLLDPKLDLTVAMTKPFYVPETVPLDTLLTTLQKENRRVAIVADEYGGTAGLITRGDILEEIVDYVGDEREEQKLTIEPGGKGRWLIDGSISLEEINYELDLNLEAEGADRIAGWVSAIAGHIPKPGEEVRHQGCSVTVRRVRKNRITLILLEKLETKQRVEDSDE